MRISNLLFLIAGSLLAQTPAPAPAPPKTSAPANPIGAMSQPPDKVILTIGDETMTVAQYNEFVDGLPEQYQTAARGPGKRQIVEQLINVKAMAQEARRRKLDQDPGYKAQVAFQSENILASVLFRDMAAKLKIEDADLHKYYDEHKTTDYERVKARHILIRVKGSRAPAGGKPELTDEEALDKAKALRARIVAGEDFATLAKAESYDTGSGVNGGDLNFFSRNQMVRPFAEAAFALPIGQVSEPVKSEFGYHLILVEKREAKTFDEVRPEIEKKLKPDAEKQLVENLRKQTTVKIDDSFFGPAPAAPPVLAPAK
jgi:peptidyl-prolyl cis-trans isomerase C